MKMSPWIIKSKIKKFKWTGKLVTFKNSDLKDALRRHFRKPDSGQKYSEINEPLPDIFLVLGYDTIRNTRLHNTTGNVHFLAGENIVYFHLAPQFCSSGEIVELTIDLFFKELECAK